MFRIRRVHDDATPLDRRVIVQVQQILRSQFPELREQEVVELPQKLRNPSKYKFRALLYVADDLRGDVRGFALVLHDPHLRFLLLDFLATGRQLTGSGVGGALYERVRDEARALNVLGIFYECLPDDPEQCPNRDVLRANASRLRFYERYGARPIVNTLYESPVKPDERGMPFLVFDDLGSGKPLRRQAARHVVRAVLERKYAYLCPPAYVDKVVASFRDDPVRLRPFKYIKPEAVTPVQHGGAEEERIVLVINDKHDIHHIRERGYVEAPVRIAAIRKEIEPTGLFRRIEPKEHSDNHIKAVHDAKYVDYLRRCCENVPPGKAVYPYVFPLRNAARPPEELAIRAGYYCIDTFTPLNHNAYLAAKRAVDCALSGAYAILEGHRLAYALVRPPGHHAEHRAFGGFCYFNNCAVAAQLFSRHGKVAILDIDYHHGNGQQVIFYDRPDVLTVSIHGHPKFAYPYFTGFEDERGAGAGDGCNVNYALPERIEPQQYRQTLERALSRIRRFGPNILVVALGLDTAKGDPTGTWTLTARDFEENGRMIGAVRLPTLVVQEGGYRTRTLGVNARNFFKGLAAEALGARAANERAAGRGTRR